MSLCDQGYIYKAFACGAFVGFVVAYVLAYYKCKRAKTYEIREWR